MPQSQPSGSQLLPTPPFSPPPGTTPGPEPRAAELPRAQPGRGRGRVSLFPRELGHEEQNGGGGGVGKVLGAGTADLKSGWGGAPPAGLPRQIELREPRGHADPPSNPHSGGGQGPSPLEDSVGSFISTVETILLMPP